MPEVQPKEIKRYITSDGRVPFAEWFDSFKDANTQAKIRSRLNRVITGNFGDYRSVGEGVCELRIDYGPGFRIYFGQVGTTIVILLCGGDKSTQSRDIRQAKEYWTDYNRSESND
ncbi:type II toxin-antitoxin system RelE/ParE family toxin [Microcoleus sp. bin38.metabat.b11b12b14.051]|uniref:type II toxin-antitoxin system RelE/ParE family toxin n=1 Tax=Microcoleus sp. bin38.metabat.b11b12b14.051 TaxID=2742709 RepID=UPI0025E038CF|nr:type II toxin-antitoxin system RelE/ParE family toxin [Microcoleus sp. bin38.metabat.b11b12b14.051]